jgi:hypothetical protein
MPTDGVRRVRASRPSRYGPPEPESDEAEVVRLSNLEVYTQRASAGLPIFEEAQPLRATGRRTLRT